MSLTDVSTIVTVPIMARATATPTAGTRETRRLETRRRIFDAAVAEFADRGVADAEVGAIVAAAGVARGTFYFHFPTKEHVLVELELREEDRIVARLRRRGVDPTDGPAPLLAEVVKQVMAAERRVGARVFRDMLAMHFAPTRPFDDEVAEHPLATHLVTTVAALQGAGVIAAHHDAAAAGVLFLTGLFAILATSQGRARHGHTSSTCTSPPRAREW